MKNLKSLVSLVMALAIAMTLVTMPAVAEGERTVEFWHTLTGVNDADYQTPFPFNGKIDKITLTVDRPKLSPEDEKKLAAAQRAKSSSD